MRKSNLKFNAILNIIRQCLSVLFPLITYPYAMRILGTENVGKVNFGISIVSYFALFAMLGTSTYAVREGAKFRDDKNKIIQFASEVFTINLIFTIISYIVFIITVLSVDKLKSYRCLLVIQSLALFLGTIGVEWINVIYEDFASITIRSIVSHIISLIALLCFVHDKDDYYIYAIIVVLSTGLSNLFNWFYCKRYILLKPVIKKKIILHLKPLLILFANAAVISIYVNFDITMLGWYIDDKAVGIYSMAVKIYTILKNVLVAVYAVTIPRLSSFVGKNDYIGYKKLYTEIVSTISIVLIPCAIGVMLISPEIMYFMGGKDCLQGYKALLILSIALVFAIFGGLVTACLNVTIGNEKDNLIAVVISAVLNVLLNMWFIPNYSYIGAAITTLISELFVLVFCTIKLKNKTKYLDAKKTFISLLHSVVGAIVMVIFCTFIRFVFSSRLLIVFTDIIGGLTIYSLVLFAFNDSFFVGLLLSINEKYSMLKQKK